VCPAALVVRACSPGGAWRSGTPASREPNATSSTRSASDRVHVRSVVQAFEGRTNQQRIAPQSVHAVASAARLLILAAVPPIGARAAGRVASDVSSLTCPSTNVHQRTRSGAHERRDRGEIGTSWLWTVTSSVSAGARQELVEQRRESCQCAASPDWRTISPLATWSAARATRRRNRRGRDRSVHS
jgi:hypothetical protein